MKFTRMRLVGFKTFVEPTELLIEPGLTGIVGPNGCGKSNLVEALRWVMGENSFKNMRAAGMDEVIFAGSGNRPARNTGEVMLTIDNRQRLAPAVFNDLDTLEVLRRIERGAGSTYRINGREVRARDVQLLFADASTGARSPAMVRQGQIGEIVNAKPQARRRVLEEAAGIAGLHARRHEAETRLRGAEHNLERLEDVVGQLEGQMDSLRRQARQAVRYRALSAEIRRCEARLALIRHGEALSAVAEAGRAVAAAEIDVQDRTRDQAEAARLQAIAAHQLPALREEAAGAAVALQRLIIALEQLDGEESRTRERLEDLRRRLQQIDEDRARGEELIADSEAVFARLSAEEAALTAAAANAAGISAAAERVASCEAALATKESEQGQAVEELARIAAQRSQVQRLADDAQTRIARLTAQMADVEAESARLAASGDQTEIRRQAELALSTAQETLAAREAAALAAEAALKRASDAEEGSRGPLREAERQFQSLETEIRTLRTLLDGGQKSGFAPIVDALRVEPGFEAALGAALGDDLDAPLDARSPHYWAGAASVDDPALPAGVACLADHVAAPDQLQRRLRQIGVVEASEGARLQQQLRTGQRLVSRAGDLWRWDGLTSAANAPTVAARRLAERNRLVGLEAELHAARTAAETARIAAQQAADRRKEASASDSAARQDWREASRQVEGLRDALGRAEKAEAELVTRLAALKEAELRLASNRDEATLMLDEARRALVETADPAPLEARLADIRLVIAQSRAELAQARAEHQGFQREAEQRRDRLAAIARERADWAGRRDRIGEQQLSLATRKAELEAEQARLSTAPNDIMQQRRALISARADAETRQKEQADRLVLAERDLAEADRKARTALDAMAAAREALAGALARKDAAERRLVELRTSVEASFEAPVTALPRLAELAQDEALPDSRAVEADLDAARRERDRLGGVNLRADIEVKEAQERIDTMVRERDDLIEAIRKLRAAIGSLNREGRERLLASFTIVNANFERLFTLLFGGGTAELRLIESDDPLEAGLEILAQPPGKKPQTLSLLSGGEQALTAIALIFAVFLTNPAPICVLDEVDAPLDDANVARYCALIRQVARDTGTRFLVITHNPITMSEMDRLFGVTMAERGVSKLVGVDLGQAERLAAE